MKKIIVDADACPVKQEIFRIAVRLNINVELVSNSYFKIPDHQLIKLVVVNNSFDAADDWIAENSDKLSIVITEDILLAHRCLKKNVLAVISANGKEFTKENIGSAVTDRAIKADLRGGIESLKLGNKKPYSNKDRVNFKNSLDRVIAKLK